MDRYEAHADRMMDITRDSNFALWNALLTLNGIVGSAFSAVAIFEENVKFAAFGIVLLSVLSATLMVLNFRTTRDIYHTIGSTPLEEIAGMRDDERNDRLQSAKEQHRLCRRRECLSFVALGVQAVAILVLVLWKK